MFRNVFVLEAITVQIGTDGQTTQGPMEDAAALSLNLVEVAATSPLVFGAQPILTFNDPTAVPFDATNAATTPLYLTFDLPRQLLDCNTLYSFTITSSSVMDRGFSIERSTTNTFAGGDGLFTGANGVATLRPNDDAVFFLQGFILGDVDCNGVFDFLDIGPLIIILTSGTFNEKADANGDGVINFLDIAPFIILFSC